ncbi:MAG: response regulator [Bdellovibrio sp.]|nr:response regulator [Bdellovibrio sp.]
MIIKKLLLLEDDQNLRQALAEDFTEKGYEVVQAETIKQIKYIFFDYAIIDLRLLADSGLKAIPELRSQNPQCRIVVLTGYGSVATAVEAVKLGAINYLHKPASSELIEAALNDQLKKDQSDIQAFEITPLEKHAHEYIEFVLTKNDGNITKTAKQLGLHRQSLQRKLKKYP